MTIAVDWDIKHQTKQTNKTDRFFLLVRYNKLEMVHCIYGEVTGYNNQIKIVFLSPKMVFVLANSLDPDEISHNATFHQGLHCLLKYTSSTQRVKEVNTAT